MLHVREPRSGYPAEWGSWAEWRAGIRPDDPLIVWIDCALCWGRGRVLVRITPARHPDPLYALVECASCLGHGSVPNI